MPAAVGKMLQTHIGSWKGMNERVAPDTLPPGVAADLQNVLLDEVPGQVVKRQGTRQMSQLPSGLPPRDSFEFKKLSGVTLFIVSDGVTVYYTSDPSNASLWTLIKTGLTSTAFMEFESAEDKIWMFNGVDPVMSWDGTTLIVFDRTFTSTTNLTTVNTTSFIHAGLTSSDDYWNGMKLVFTVGANVGTVVLVTDYVESSKTITFTPAVAGIAATDRFVVGLIIPAAASCRYWDGHMFIANTTDNPAQVRFNTISDPDTGAFINIDNPRAWPAQNQLQLNILDEDRIWGLSPILRDRIMVQKQNSLYRLERDPLVTYRPEIISRAIGSRFTDSWVEKNNLLYFLGQDKDGIPEVYKTDMVDVNLVDPDGGLEPTLRGLRQANSVLAEQTFTSPSDFDAGSLSTGTKTSGGSLEIGGFSTDALWNAAISKNNIGVGDLSGAINIIGVPSWTEKYNATVLPTAASPAWYSLLNNGLANLLIRFGDTLDAEMAPQQFNGPNGYSMQRRNVLTASSGSYLAIRVRQISGFSHFGLWNGGKAVYVIISSGDITVNGASLGVAAGGGFNTYNLLLSSAGAWKLWMNGVLIGSGTAGNTTLNKVQFGLMNNQNGTSSGDFAPDPFIFDNAFGYNLGVTGHQTDGLPCQAYYTQVYHNQALAGESIPSTVPTSGQIVVQVDYTRAPDAFLRAYLTETLYGGTVVMESWSSTSSDFSSGNDAAGYVVVANGAVPTSVVKRYQRFRLTLTRADLLNGPVITNLQTGILWTSPAVNVGQNIGGWRTFLDTLTTPAGTNQIIKIRRATVTAAPIESDWGAWFAIVNGNNIGTILSDTTTPPTSRWAQLKVEQGPSSGGLLPFVESMVIQWTIGSATVLPIRAVVHKKRMMIVCATSVASANNLIVVLDRNDQWTKFTGLSLNSLIHFKSVLYGLDAGDAYVSQLDIDGVYNDYGNAIDAFLVDREDTLKSEHLRKDFRYAYLHNDRITGGNTLLTYYKRRGDTDFTGSGTFTIGAYALDVRQNFPVGTLGRTIQRKYRNNTVDQNMSFMGETLFYIPRPLAPTG